MTGPKIPPGGGPPPKPSAPATTTTGPQKPASSGKSDAARTDPGEEPTAKEMPKGDSFESFRAFSRGTTDVTRLDDAFGHASSPSGIENLVRMLDAARAQLLAEHKALRDVAQGVIERLVQSGFSTAQLERAKHELAELRKKMAALRKRLQHMQRRLKSAFASAGKTGDLNFAKQLGAQLDRLKKMEPGLERAMTALSTIEQAYGSFADGSTPVWKLSVGDGEIPSAKLGEAIATFAPGAAVNKAALAMLRDGPAAPAPKEEQPEGNELVDGMRALGDALCNPGSSPARRPSR
jgi:hypothetical protein